MKWSVATVLLALAPALAQADDYSTDPSLCKGGRRITDSDETLAIGAGSVSVGSLNCERKGAKKILKDGWFTADWACSSEGEESGPVSFDLRVSGDKVELRSDGNVTVYHRC